MIISIDTECSGLDLFFGARPFLVTICGDRGPKAWEWDVDPLTRCVTPNPAHLAEITELLRSAETIVLHNSRFDAKALDTIGVTLPWEKVEDTIVASHVLSSGLPHNLTDVASRWLSENIAPHEKVLEEAVKKCRRIIQQARLRDRRGKDTTEFAQWRVAEEGMPDLPSAKGGSSEKGDQLWRSDYWLPRAVSNYYRTHRDLTPDFDTTHYSTVLRDYAHCDSMVTFALWHEMEGALRRRNLWKVYRARLESVPAAYRMEKRGVTIDRSVLCALRDEYTEEAEYLGKVCVGIARRMGYTLELPKGATNHCLDDFVFGRAERPDGKRDATLPRHHQSDTLNLPVVKTTDSGAPSFDSEAREQYLADLSPTSLAHLFVESFAKRSELDTGLSYLRGYDRFLIPTEEGGHRLHPSFNTTGTMTTRWSSQNPNAQNASLQAAIPLRKCFCPAVGRVWYSMDAANIELRIPAYLANERELIEVFERPNDPPYYGSYHLVIFDTLYPKIFAKYGKEVKSHPDYESSHYKPVKNGNFCVPMDTVALTSNGWKTYDQLKIGDKVAGHKDGRLVWTEVRNKYLVKNSPLVKLSNSYYESVTTPDHRWYGTKRQFINGVRGNVPGYFTTGEMGSEHTILLSAEMDDESRVGLTPAEAAVVALVYTDGSIEQGQYVGAPSQAGGTKVMFRARIHQSKLSGIRYITKILRLWGGRFKKGFNATGITTWTLNPADARALWRKAGLVFGTSKFDQDFEGLVLSLGTAARKEFLEAVHIAEGHTDAYGVKVYTQNESPFADAIRLAVFLCGNYVSTGKCTVTELSRNQCLRFRACRPFVTGQRMCKEDAGFGDAWCIETGTGTWVMRQGDRIMLTGNCRQYGGQEVRCDATYRVKGAFRKIGQRFPRIDALNRQICESAYKTGYVETVPDRSVDPDYGYQIMCRRNKWDRISPTVPFAYFVSGTAGWWMGRSVVKCDRLLEQWRLEEGYDGYMVLCVHDEAVYDLPSGVDNTSRVDALRKTMESCGFDIGIPTPVSVDRHTESWAVGEGVK